MQLAADCAADIIAFGQLALSAPPTRTSHDDVGIFGPASFKSADTKDHGKSACHFD
jgi:hypothetical protein